MITAQVTRLDDALLLPSEPRHYRQSITFTGYGKHRGRVIHLALVPARDPVVSLELVRTQQRGFGVEQDARVQWRDIDCGPWEDA